VGITYNVAFGGGGNRNLTVGDAIFHCHLYPHLAQGMWALWRNHEGRRVRRGGSGGPHQRGQRARRRARRGRHPQSERRPRALAATSNPFVPLAPLGAQTGTQRFWADPLLDIQGMDRTLRSAFMHDHLAASSHQQHGLYAAIIVEPWFSEWRDPVTG
jgi:hypothetical protein